MRGGVAFIAGSRYGRIEVPGEDGSPNDMVSSKLKSSDVLHWPPTHSRERNRSGSIALQRRDEVVNRRAINPVVSKVIEVRVQALEVDGRSVVETVVQCASDATTITKIPIVAQVICACQGRSGLDVVNTASVPVIRSADQCT